MKKIKWHTEKRKVKDLKLFDGNPRKMTEKQAEQLLDSLKKFNYVELIVIDQNNRVIAGNMRVQALKKLGLENEEIEVRVPSRPLTEEEAREYLLRSNKNTGEWDWDLLANFDEDLLQRVGFEGEELDKIFDLDLGEKEDEVPELRKETDIKYGDIFQLGNHRLMCGDATKKEDVEKLMDGEKADMVFTDPPYNLRKKYVNYEDNKTYEEYKDFCFLFFKNLKLFAKQNIFITPGTQNLGMWYEIEKPKWVYCWLKMNGQSRTPLGGMQKWEPILAYEEIIWEPILIYSQLSNKKIDVIISNTERQDGLREQHICPKPVKLIEELLKRFSKRGDIVLDLFGGSGSTLIACEKLNRKCYIMEIEPLYCQVIIDRWEQFTAQKAEKLKTGKKQE
jgi:DNA modification methylase